MSEKEKQEVKANADAREAAMKLLGISQDALAVGIESDAKKAFETKKSQIEVCDELQNITNKIKQFGAPIRITIESNGDKGVTPTQKISFPKSVTSRGDGARGNKCVVDNVEYESYAAACDRYGLSHEGISGKVVLNRALDHGKIKSFGPAA